MQKSPTRRSVTAGLALGALAAPGLRIGPARAQAKSVKMAMIAPLSGPWARQGQLLRQGAEMAIDEINQKGGIEKLGGAKFELVVADAGDSTEKAKNAAQRLLSDQPDLIGGFGAWLSSFTLAVTEVTERAQLPWLTLSYSNAITNRGFKFNLPDRRLAGRRDPADGAQARRARDRQTAEDDRHHPGQHRRAGQLR
jgi:branched-chain amino acid transport system substrate-binding protein